MKRKVVIALVCAMAASTVLGGCGKKGNNANGSSAGEEKDVQISAAELLKATDYNVEDYVTLNDYMGMDIELEDKYEVSEDDIKTYAEQLIAMYPAYEKTDKTTVEKEDMVNIDYEGKIDGETFTGGSAEGAHLEIGSGSFIDGFEDGLIGKKVGDKVELNLKFPDDYSNSDVAGKDVVFTVTINSIDKETDMTYETLTDEYVNSNFASSGMTTVDEFKDQVKSGLESQNESTKQSDLQSAVLDKLVKECKVEIPDGLLEQKKTEYKTTVEKAAEEQNMSLEDYTGMTEENFDEQMDSYMEDNLVQELILEAIVQDQNISISSNDFSSFVTSYVSYYQMDSEEAFYDQYGGEAYVKLSYAENQALNKVIEAAKVTYTDSAAQDDTDKDSTDSSAEE